MTQPHNGQPSRPQQQPPQQPQPPNRGQFKPSNKPPQRQRPPRYMAANGQPQQPAPRRNVPRAPNIKELPPLPPGWMYNPAGQPVRDPSYRPDTTPPPKPPAKKPKKRKRKLTEEEIEELKRIKREIAEAEALIASGELDLDDDNDDVDDDAELDDLDDEVDEQPEPVKPRRPVKAARRTKRAKKPQPEPVDEPDNDDDDDELNEESDFEEDTPAARRRRRLEAGGASQRPQKSRSKALIATFIVAGTLIVGGSAAAGVYLITDGAKEEVRQVDTPLPPQQITEAKNTKELKPRLGSDEQITSTGKIMTSWSKQYPVHDADTGGGEGGWSDWSGKTTTPLKMMSIEQMAPMSVFIPEIGIYFQVRPSDTFTESNYQNFDTLSIPDNPHRGVWYKDGAPLTGGDKGTTLIGSHVSHGTQVRGALYDMHKLQLGTVIWTKDDTGKVTSWKMNKLWYEPHRQFPQEYFSAEGPRQLVLTTCGGHLNPEGYFDQNIFAVAVPTAVNLSEDDPDGKPQPSEQPSSSVAVPPSSGADTPPAPADKPQPNSGDAPPPAPPAPGAAPPPDEG